jgi:hypothetical protein
MRLLLALSILALALVGCAEQPVTVIKTVTIDRPVPVACVPADLPPPPTYPDTVDTLKAAQGHDGRYQLLTEGWRLRVWRLDLLEGVVAACRTAALPQ